MQPLVERAILLDELLIFLVILGFEVPIHFHKDPLIQVIAKELLLFLRRLQLFELVFRDLHLSHLGFLNHVIIPVTYLYSVLDLGAGLR